MKVEFIDSLDKFNECKAEWLKFEGSLHVNQISSSYDYLNIFWKHYSGMLEKNVLKKELMIVKLFKNNSIKAIFPFCIITKQRKQFFKVKSLEFIGQQFFSYYSDVITNDMSTNEFHFVLEQIYEKNKIDITNLSHISEFSNIYKIKIGNSYSFNVCYLYDINKFSNYDKYQKSYSSSHKQNIRTAKNRIAKDMLRYEEIAKPYHENEMPEIERISRSKLKDSKICLYDDKVKREMAMELYNVFKAQIIYIKLNDKNVAYRTNLFYRNCKFCFDASFDRDYKRYSIGMLSVESNIKDSFANNNSGHSEGWGNDPYKEKFSTGNAVLYSKIIRGNTFFSAAWLKEYERPFKEIKKYGKSSH